jgi:teichuronic acid biosynthesis glycosyltransferase TuaC
VKLLVVTAMYPTPENPAFGSFVKAQVECLRKAGVDVEVMVLSGRRRKLIYPKGVWELRRRLRLGDVDLVHAHYSYVGVVGRLQRSVPLVVTFHGSDLLGSRDQSGALKRSNSLTVPTGRLLARFADAVVVQSKQMKRLVCGANAHIIPHEIDFDLFHPTERTAARRQLGLDVTKKYLLFAAKRENGVKNFALASATADQLKKSDTNVELLVVFKEPQDRLALYMSAADALVFPSFSEGSPNVVKQAMACNLPIVATDVGDIREVIEGTRACHIVDFTVESVASALRSVLATCPRTDGRERVSRFSCSVVGQQLIDLYQDVLDQRDSRERMLAAQMSAAGRAEESHG